MLNLLYFTIMFFSVGKFYIVHIIYYHYTKIKKK